MKEYVFTSISIINMLAADGLRLLTLMKLYPKANATLLHILAYCDERCFEFGRWHLSTLCLHYFNEQEKRKNYFFVTSLHNTVKSLHWFITAYHNHSKFVNTKYSFVSHRLCFGTFDGFESSHQHGQNGFFRANVSRQRRHYAQRRNHRPDTLR